MRNPSPATSHSGQYHARATQLPASFSGNGPSQIPSALRLQSGYAAAGKVLSNRAGAGAPDHPAARRNRDEEVRATTSTSLGERPRAGRRADYFRDLGKARRRAYWCADTPIRRRLSDRLGILPLLHRPECPHHRRACTLEPCSGKAEYLYVPILVSLKHKLPWFSATERHDGARGR